MSVTEQVRVHHVVQAEGHGTWMLKDTALGRTLRALKARAERLQGAQQLAYAQAITYSATLSYWRSQQALAQVSWAAPVVDRVELVPLDDVSMLLLLDLEPQISNYAPLTAGYLLGEIYTALLPDSHRSTYGVFYTPPPLTARLMTLAEHAGTDWRTCRVLDPACGGGAFLTPLALAKVKALEDTDPAQVLEHISTHLHGIELDPFSAWLSQTLLEIALFDVCQRAGRRLPQLVTTADALLQKGEAHYDLVIGNPPYGRVTLSPELRRRYQRSLYGHANIYGLFMDLAVQLTKPGGTIAFVTPTSFLGGQYFKALRTLMAQEAPPLTLDLVHHRAGVFSAVLQETLLATYRRGGTQRTAAVHQLSLIDEAQLAVIPAGSCELPRQPSDPWLVPRDSDQAGLVQRMQVMPHRLRDYGYGVSTGPLVWNRHKPQLRDQPEAGAYPIIWAEAVGRDGRFTFKTEKKNHRPFLRLRAGDGWLIIDRPCVLVQRTTAKEQARRLIAAELPANFIAQYGAVSVENHLNMVRPLVPHPLVPLSVIAALLNSATVDAAFRCISGSVAVSAAELEALPLPPPEAALRLAQLIAAGADAAMIERRIHSFYLDEASDAA